MGKLDPALKIRALELLAQGKSPGEIAKELKVPAFAVGAWRAEAARKKGQRVTWGGRVTGGAPPAPATATSGGAPVKLTILTVPEPEEDEGVPTGSGAGGADAARAAGTETKPEGQAGQTQPVDAEKVPEPLLDPVEAVIGITRLATFIYTVVACNTHGIEWDEKYAEWTPVEEGSLRNSAPGMAAFLGPWLLKYAEWAGALWYTGTLFMMFSMRNFQIKKGVPKEKTEAKVRDASPGERREERPPAPRPPPRPGHIPSFWDEHPNG